VGSSYSAEDISLQCAKYGSGDIICSYRTRPMGFKWPANITERPLLTHVDGKVVHFTDGSTAEVDAIIFCTGYLHHYPYLDDSIRLRTPNLLYPPYLYKGTVYTEGGNNKVLYIGSQDQYYTYTMFDAQALWAVKCALGDIKLPNKDAMVEDWKKWVER
jgi:trimethylamine monooxygenase